MGEWNADSLDQSDGGWVNLEHKGQAIDEVIGVKEIVQ